MTMFLMLVIGWGAATFFGARYAGLNEKTPWSWMPARFIAEWLALGARRWTGIFLGIVGLALLCWGMEGDGLIRGLASSAGLFVVIPVPFYLFDLGERRQTVRGREIVFFNMLAPLTTRHERTLEGGRLEEVGAVVVFYVEEDDWEKVPAATDEVRRYLKRYEIGPGLYRAYADNDFLQVFDSLDLYRFILNPEHEKAVEMFRRLLRKGGSANGPAEVKGKEVEAKGGSGRTVGVGGGDGARGEVKERVVAAASEPVQAKEQETPAAVEQLKSVGKVAGTEPKEGPQPAPAPSREAKFNPALLTQAPDLTKAGAKKRVSSGQGKLVQLSAEEFNFPTDGERKER